MKIDSSLLQEMSFPPSKSQSISPEPKSKDAKKSLADQTCLNNLKH